MSSLQQCFLLKILLTLYDKVDFEKENEPAYEIMVLYAVSPEPSLLHTLSKEVDEGSDQKSDV